MIKTKRTLEFEEKRLKIKNIWRQKTENMTRVGPSNLAINFIWLYIVCPDLHNDIEIRKVCDFKFAMVFTTYREALAM